MSSKSEQELWQAIPVDARYTRRNAGRAMSGYMIRGLIELLTNGRDSGRRMLSEEQLTHEDLLSTPLELTMSSGEGGKAQFTVRDRFEGMTGDVMRDQLLRYGALSSGYDTAEGVRGLNARGAKDVGILGEVKFESIVDGTLSTCKVVLGKSTEPKSRPATEEDRSRLGLFEVNGTVVQLSPFPETKVPRFETLAKDLERHIEIRYSPKSLGTVPLDAVESQAKGGVKERRILGFAPEGELLLDKMVDVPGYSHVPGQVHVRLYRSKEALKVGGKSITRLWRSEAGVIVADGRTAHDITFFGAMGSSDVGAAHLFGLVEAPQVAELLSDFEEFEVRRSEDTFVAPDPRNPDQVTDPDRQGLNGEHPYSVALFEVVRPLVEEALANIEEALRPDAEDRVGEKLRNALKKLGEELAEKLEIGEGDPLGGKILPVGLSVVPPNVRVTIENTKRVGVYFKGKEPLTEPMDCALSTESGALELLEELVTLEPVPDSGVLRGYAEVRGLALTDAAFVDVEAGGEEAVLRVSVRDEPGVGEIQLDQDLQFSRSRYTSVPGRSKTIDVYADESLDGQSVSITASGTGVELLPKSAVLAFDAELGVCRAQFQAACDHEAIGVMVVASRELEDSARVVFRDLKGKPRIKFKLEEDESYRGVRRFRWEAAKNQVLIAAKHSTLKRVLGPDVDPKTGEQWPGQDSPQARAILAEIVAEAYVDRMMQRELETLGIGPENLVDPVDFEDLRYTHFDEVLRMCHKALTPSYSK